MSVPYPFSAAESDGLLPEPAVAALGRAHHVSAWTGFITLYGTRRTIAAAEKEVKALLARAGSRVHILSERHVFFLRKVANRIPGKLGRRLSMTAAKLAQALELVNGRPSEAALPLAYWRARVPQPDEERNPARDGCGLIWYAPLVPMRAADVRAHVTYVTEIARRHGIEPLITLTSVSERLFASTVPILFDRECLEAADSAKRCYLELLETGRAAGCYPYRLGIDAMQSLSGTLRECKAFHDRLAQAVDPDDAISPGRYR